MRLPPTKVPAKETTYMCHATALPQDADYHIIATTPIINTTSLLHHVLIYLCTSYDENGQ
jgi:dopamine beta-monooxygenase